jgi:serine/threonine protein kinase
MPRYEGSLRGLLQKRLAPADVFPFFSQVLDGVEAAHLKGVLHRDLKPENILYRQRTLAIADFGIARFTEDPLIAAVQTKPSDRLANFLYAAPEQRVPGGAVTATADIYALGLMLNEMFTGAVPHGTEYAKIGPASKQHEYLDQIVDRMLRHSPSERPQTISEVKTLILKYQDEAVAHQRLSTITNTVIKVGEIDDPLAYEPPKLVDAKWDNGTLRLILDRPVNDNWIRALHNMGNYTSLWGKPPEAFRFIGNQAVIDSSEQDAQQIVNHFKPWLPKATAALRTHLQQEATDKAARQREQLRQQREAEERRLRVNSALRV